MTVPELLQLYAPLAGMLALAFWVGVLSERVKTLQGDVQELKDDGTKGGAADRLTRLEVQMENLGAGVDKLGRGMEGVQRQLGNLMHKSGSIIELNP